MNGTENVENWFSRAKAEADKGVPRNERVFGIAIVVVSVLMILYFVVHQTGSTGFFTTEFGTLEMVMLYGNLTAWIITGALEGVFGRKSLSRDFDAFGGFIIVIVGITWLLVVFPFEFANFANVLPDFLRFLVQWISNEIARVLMVLVLIVTLVMVVYSTILRVFVRKELSKRKK